MPVSSRIAAYSRPIAVALRDAESALEMRTEVGGEAVVVEQRVVDVEQPYGRCVVQHGGLFSLTGSRQPSSPANKFAASAGPPGTGLVERKRRAGSENRIDDAPCGLHGLVTREQRRVAAQCGAEQPLVRRFLALQLVPCNELHRLAAHLVACRLHPDAGGNQHFGAQPEAEIIRLRRRGVVEDRQRRFLQVDDDLGCRDRQALAGADVERHARPAPRVDMQAQRDERLDLRICGDTRLVPVAAELAADHLRRIERPHRAKQPQLLGVHRLRILAGRRVHREQRNDLQQVVLDDVAHGADFLVEAAASLHAEALGHRDLHAVDVIAVPQGLEQRICKPEVQEVLHGLLAEVMVDPEDRRLGKNRRAASR